MDRLDFEMQVKRALREKGMLAKELAEMLGITSAYCSDIIRGNRSAPKKREEIKKILNLKGE